MTIVVFDGEVLVTDGMEVYSNSNFPEYMNRDSVVKIVILPKPWKYLENSVITAIAGSGSVEDIEMVKGEIFRAINLGERASDFSRRFEVSCLIVTFLVLVSVQIKLATEVHYPLGSIRIQIKGLSHH